MQNESSMAGLMFIVRIVETGVEFCWYQMRIAVTSPLQNLLHIKIATESLMYYHVDTTFK
jgi:hypothetical protein